MKINHTKGPWTITNYSDTVCIQNIREMPMKNGTIKETVFEITQGIIPNTANINLIAAAPEMLESLKLAQQALLLHIGKKEQTELDISAHYEIIEIIKKARGE